MRHSRMGRLGAKAFNLAELKEIIRDGKIWTGLGVVVKRPEDSAHYEIVSEGGSAVDVLVDVDLMPNKEPLFCRLGSFAGGAGLGVWRIPPVGTEVVVIIPDGEFEGGPMIVATLASRDVPSQLDEDTLVVRNSKNVKIISDDGTVNVNGDTYNLPKWNDFLSDFTSWLNTLNTLLGTLVPVTGATGGPAYTTAIGLPTSIVVKSGNPANYTSDKAKNG